MLSEGEIEERTERFKNDLLGTPRIGEHDIDKILAEEWVPAKIRSIESCREELGRKPKFSEPT